MKALQQEAAGYRGVTAVQATAKLGPSDAAREIAALHAVRHRRLVQGVRRFVVFVLLIAAVWGLVALARGR